MQSSFMSKLVCALIFFTVPLVTIPICSTIIYQYYQIYDYKQEYCITFTNYSIVDLWGSYSYCDGYAKVATATTTGGADSTTAVHLINPPIDHYLIQVSYQDCENWINYYSIRNDYICYVNPQRTSGYTNLPSITPWLLTLILSCILLFSMIMVLIRLYIIHINGYSIRTNLVQRRICPHRVSIIEPPSYGAHERDSLVPHAEGAEASSVSLVPPAYQQANQPIWINYHNQHAHDNQHDHDHENQPPRYQSI